MERHSQVTHDINQRGIKMLILFMPKAGERLNYYGHPAEGEKLIRDQV